MISKMRNNMGKHIKEVIAWSGESYPVPKKIILRLLPDIDDFDNWLNKFNLDLKFSDPLNYIFIERKIEDWKKKSG